MENARGLIQKIVEKKAEFLHLAAEKPRFFEVFS